MLRTAGEAESTAGHGGRRTGAGRPRYVALDWENRHVRVRLERPLHQAWVKLRESGGFQDDSSFSSGAPGRCRPGRAWARAQAAVPGPASVTSRPYWLVYETRNAHARPVG